MSVCLHRYFSHKGFKCGRVTQFALYIGGCLASQVWNKKAPLFLRFTRAAGVVTRDDRRGVSPRDRDTPVETRRGSCAPRARGGVRTAPATRATPASSTSSTRSTGLGRSDSLCFELFRTNLKTHVDASRTRREKRTFSDRRRARCLLYTSPSPRDATLSRMPSSA